ncbi:hypothetical protein GCM10027515_26650 [Schumannella luteola]|uniref:Uncharacterized protein n=1 Tax=Schumannella luteola TaxID=472059 RepID=A0A852YK41_9MICO|nr:hypothetical protein [Schumannella luteola]NYG99538.1 hypothetical protein [Schumannella luteola]TPX03855.1 hypothetical protein FJ656_15095 [Schumannella luteola]
MSLKDELDNLFEFDPSGTIACKHCDWMLSVNTTHPGGFDQAVTELRDSLGAHLMTAHILPVRPDYDPTKEQAA